MTLLFILVLLIALNVGGAVLTKTNAAKKVSSGPSTANRVVGKKYSWELDTSAMLSKSTFKIKPAALIERCKVVVNNGIGLKNADDLSEDFQFIFPVVGPLSKKEYLDAVGGFELGKMFPGFDRGLYFDFRVDPFEYNRVWFTASFNAKHSGEGPFGKPTDILVTCPPQTISLTFNEEGKCTRYTGGYVMDKTVGNSGGLGGVFGPLYAIGRGLPFPEAKPYSKSIQFQLFNFIGTTVAKFASKKK